MDCKMSIIIHLATTYFVRLKCGSNSILLIKMVLDIIFFIEITKKYM